jgi:ferredoxin-NADP reductase
VTARDCYVCGPPVFLDVVRRRLRMIGVPGAAVHFERFEF